jgi:hypothetical protein
MNAPPRFQYSLRTLLIIMTVSAVLMGFLAPLLRMIPPEVAAVIAISAAFGLALSLCPAIAVWLVDPTMTEPSSEQGSKELES